MYLINFKISTLTVCKPEATNFRVKITDEFDRTQTEPCVRLVLIYCFIKFSAATPLDSNQL
jgi:hypothetical protein